MKGMMGNMDTRLPEQFLLCPFPLPGTLAYEPAGQLPWEGDKFA